MTNRERVLELILRQPGLTDEQIRRKTGIESHQQVNQICRNLAAQGVVIRRPGQEGLIVNLPIDPARSEEPVSAAPRVVISASWMPRQAEGSILRFDPSSTLIVLPCSGRKVRLYGGSSGRAVLDLLPESLAAELRAARQANMAAVHLDESVLGPALDVYDGTMYQIGRDSIRSLMVSGATVAIISGGYGVVLASESIGVYDQIFRASLWPHGLVGRCLAELARARRIREVVGLMAATTGYAKAFCSAPWGPTRAVLATPEPVRGAMVKAPRALGEALEVLAASHALLSDWRSSDGLSMEVVECRSLTRK